MRTTHAALLALVLALFLSNSAFAFGPPEDDDTALTEEQQADQDRRDRLEQLSQKRQANGSVTEPKSRMSEIIIIDDGAAGSAEKPSE